MKLRLYVKYLEISVKFYQFLHLKTQTWQTTGVEERKYYKWIFQIIFGRNTVDHWTEEHMPEFSDLSRAFGEYQVSILFNMFYCKSTE